MIQSKLGGGGGGAGDPVHTFMAIDHQTISKVIQLQEVLLPVTSESMYMKSWLIAQSSLLRNTSVFRRTDRLDMTIART